MASLPTITALTQLVDPATGKPTLQFIDFWGQLVRQVNANTAAIAAQQAPSS